MTHRQWGRAMRCVANFSVVSRTRPHWEPNRVTVCQQRAFPDRSGRIRGVPCPHNSWCFENVGWRAFEIPRMLGRGVENNMSYEEGSTGNEIHGSEGRGRIAGLPNVRIGERDVWDELAPASAPLLAERDNPVRSR